MPNSPIQPVVIRCPHVVLCASAPVCKAFGAVKAEVLKADLCPEARSKRHVAETAERFEQASDPEDTPTVEVDTHFEVKGDEIR